MQDDADELQRILALASELVRHARWTSCPHSKRVANKLEPLLQARALRYVDALFPGEGRVHCHTVETPVFYDCLVWDRKRIREHLEWSNDLQERLAKIKQAVKDA